MGKATTIIRVILILALTLGIFPVVLQFYTYFTGEELPIIWKVLSPIIIFFVAWVTVTIAVYSIKRGARREFSRSIG